MIVDDFRHSFTILQDIFEGLVAVEKCCYVALTIGSIFPIGVSGAPVKEPEAASRT